LKLSVGVIQETIKVQLVGVSQEVGNAVPVLDVISIKKAVADAVSVSAQYQDLVRPVVLEMAITVQPIGTLPFETGRVWSIKWQKKD
jgi:hypothetical protein